MDRARELVESLQKNNVVVAIPSIVLAEALCFVPDRDLQKAMDGIKARFPVFQFDELSAYFYRAVFSSTKDIKTEQPRWSKSADVKIIATAKAHGASCIYSEDSGMAKLAEGTLKVEGLPPLPQRQRPLPLSSPMQ
jgi:predicted nucleic acid-binding protein